MKKWGSMLLALLCAAALCLPLAGCADKPKAEETAKTTQSEGMTEEKILALAEQHWGVRNGVSARDEQNIQRMVKLSVVGYPTKDEPYYVVLYSRQNANGGWDSLDTLKLDGETGKIVND